MLSQNMLNLIPIKLILKLNSELKAPSITTSSFRPLEPGPPGVSAEPHEEAAGGV